MDQYNLANLTKELKIASLNIVRENIEVGVLNAFSQSAIADKLIFYGGTAIRLAYGSPRFSANLDFLMTKKIPVKELEKTLKEFIVDHPEITIKDLKGKRNTLFALLNIKSPFLKHPINMKIEIAKRKDGIKHDFIPLSSPCSHLRPIMPTIKIESLEKLKEETIKNRNEPRDWFDLWYIRKYLKKPFELPARLPFDEKDFERELKRFLPRDRWNLISQIAQ